MKVTRKQAVKFLTALGFPKSAEWKKDKVIEMLEKTSDSVKRDDVPEDFHEFFDELDAAKPGTIEAVKGKKSDKKKESTSLVEKPAKKKLVKAAKKKAAVKKDVIPTDQFGNRVGTVSAKMNDAMMNDDREWMTIEQVAKAAGITVVQSRNCLFLARRGGWVKSKRAMVLYRIDRKSKGKS